MIIKPYANVCLPKHVCVRCMSADIFGGQKKGARSVGTGIAGGCELPVVGTGN